MVRLPVNPRFSGASLVTFPFFSPPPFLPSISPAGKRRDVPDDGQVIRPTEIRGGVYLVESAIRLVGMGVTHNASEERIGGGGQGAVPPRAACAAVTSAGAALAVPSVVS